MTIIYHVYHNLTLYISPFTILQPTLYNCRFVLRHYLIMVGKRNKPAWESSASSGRRQLGSLSFAQARPATSNPLRRPAYSQQSRPSFSVNSSGNSSIRMTSVADLKPPQVIEYLMKKGYLRTEQVLRQESAQVDKDGRPVFDRDEYGNEKYIRGFELLSSWIDSNLDIYKVR